jgi:hypothetical protein
MNSSKGSLKGLKHVQIWQEGMANALVTDEQGQRVGFLESGEAVNEIPDAEIRNLRFGFGPNSVHAPIIFVPMQSKSIPHLKVNVSSKANDSYESEIDNIANTVIIAPGFSVASSIPDLGQGQQQSIELMPAEEGYAVTFSNNEALSPTISIDTNFQAITINGLNIDPSGLVNFNMNPAEGSFGLKTAGNINPGTIQLQLSSLDEKSGESATFNSLGLSLQQNDGVSLRFADSDNTNTVSIPSLRISHANGDTEKAALVLTDMSGQTHQSTFDAFVKDVLMTTDLSRTQMDFRSSMEISGSGTVLPPIRPLTIPVAE